MSSHERKEEHALFWYRLIAPLLDDGLERTERSALLQAILSKDYKIPGSRKTRISRATLFRKLVACRRFGLKGLIKPDRADKGASHSIKPEWVNKAIELRLEGPHGCTRRVIDMLEHHFALDKGAIKHNTLARVFQEKKLTRFGYRHINELWMSDVMHGIPLPDPRDHRKRRMTYLISVIDDASRLIPHGEFYFDEKLPLLENTLKKALVKRGIPVRLFTWFFAWLEIAYHHKPHSALGQTPIAFWMKQASRIRLPDPDALDTVFLWRQDRLVSKVHTFQLMGNLYEVPPELSGRTIEIRFNPFDLCRILVFENGAFLCRAPPASLPQPRHPRAPKPLPQPRKPLCMSYLDTLLEKYEQHIKAEFGTLDFQKIESKGKASMEETKGKFVEALQQHLGRRLGCVEIAAARGLHDELAPIDFALVRDVPSQGVADIPAFGEFLSQLRSLILKRRQSKAGA